VSEHVGELAGIGVSLAWAISGLIFSRAPVPAGALNLFKNVIASLLLLATIAGAAIWRSGPLLQVDRVSCGWLALSGLIGIVAGDTCYFRSLQILGARRSLVLTTFAPPMAGVLGWLVLDEKLAPWAIAGILCTLGGVAWVVRDPKLVGDESGHYPGSAAAAIAYGFLGSLCQAVGSILSKLGMRDVGTLDASFVRLASAAVACWVLAASLGSLGGWLRSLRAPGVPLRVFAAAFCGTYVGIWLNLVAVKHSQVAIATTLSTLSPIFVLPLARVFLGWTISPRALAGAVLAAAGVFLLF
jgi:drug/metabolite transporter (DMT)-like permease